jgi:hypothetical protein
MRGLRARNTGPGVTARVDATSAARPSTFGGLVNTTGPVVTGDTPPLVGTFQEQAWKTAAPAVRATRIDIRLANVAAATLQLARAGFGVGEHGTVVVHSDGSTSLTITGLAPSEPISRGTMVIAHADANGIAQVAVAVGNTTLTLG